MHAFICVQLDRTYVFHAHFALCICALSLSRTVCSLTYSCAHNETGSGEEVGQCALRASFVRYFPGKITGVRTCAYVLSPSRVHSLPRARSLSFFPVSLPFHVGFRLCDICIAVRRKIYQVFFAKELYKKRLYAAKETHDFKGPTNRSHPMYCARAC